MPSDVPKVNFGNIYGTGSAGSAYFVTVNVEDAELEKINDYLNGFYDQGWSQSYYYEDDMFGEKTMVFVNDGYYVQVFVGGGQVTITCDDIGNNPFAGMTSPMDTYDDTEEGAMSSGESVLGMGDLSDESFDPPSRFPDFDYGMEVEADPTMYPDAISVRMFIGVASDELVDYFIACHDEGFGLLIQGENDIMGTYEAVHSKTDRRLYFQYGFDMESLTIVEYGGQEVSVTPDSAISNEVLANTIYSIIDLNMGESKGGIDPFPDYDGYYQDLVEYDEGQVSAQGWNWAKEYAGIDYLDVANFLKSCQDGGYLVELMISDDGVSGMARVSHASLEVDYGLLIGMDNSLLIIEVDK